MLTKKDSHMSLCAEANKRNNTTLLIFFMTAAPLTLYLIGENGASSLVSSALTGVVAGAVTGGLYYGYSCGGLANCVGDGALSVGCGVASDIGSLFGS